MGHRNPTTNLRPGAVRSDEIQFTARNPLRGTVTKIVLGAVMAEGTIAIPDDHQLVTALGRGSVGQSVLTAAGFRSSPA